MGGEGSGSGTEPDPNVKTCIGKSEGASCSYTSGGTTRNGNCVQATWTSFYCNVPA